MVELQRPFVREVLVLKLFPELLLRASACTWRELEGPPAGSGGMVDRLEMFEGDEKPASSGDNCVALHREHQSRTGHCC